MRVADYLFTRIREEGVASVFLVPGGGAMYLVDALAQNSEINFVPTHHEQAATIAAEAYARINGRLGCALVTTGPGATNAITGVAGAWIESVPLLVISGQVKRADLIGDSGVRQKGPQEVDIVSMVRPITKYAATVLDPADIRYHFEKALHEATTGRRGPTWLDIPLDVQAAEVEPSSLRGCTTEETYSSDVDAAEEVIQLLNRAERPIILAGHGVRLAEAAEEFRQLYNVLDIPVVTTWNAMDLIPAGHRLAVGKPGTVALRAPNFAIQNSDLILAIGARLDNVLTAYNPAKFGRQAAKIIVDVDAAELNKFPAEMDIAHKVHADAGDFIRSLLKCQSRIIPKVRSSWLARCIDWKTRYSINDGAAFPESGVISHYHLTKVLSDEIPEDTLIVTGSSGLSVEIFYTGFANKPGQRIFHTSGLGAMGYGLPAMIGAGLAAGVQSFVGIEGDGSMMMNIQELQTIRMLDLPVKIFLFNNCGYASIRNTQRNYFDGRFVGTGPEGRLGLPDFVTLAQANGIEAMRVDNAANLVSTVREALSKRGPLIVDVRVQTDEALWPKSAALPQPDGTIRSMPLEDMSPLLARNEFRANMIVPLDPASEELPEQLITQSKNVAKP